MSGFQIPPTFAPPQYAIDRTGPLGYVLTLTASGAQFAPATGGGGKAGAYLKATPAAGTYTLYNPPGFGTTIGRLDIDTSAGNVIINSFVVGADAQELIVTNIGANTLELTNVGMRMPGVMFIPTNDAARLVYNAGTINLWCMA